MKIFLGDVTAKFVCVRFPRNYWRRTIDNSSIGGVSGFDGKIGEFDGRSILSGVNGLPLGVFGDVDTFEASDRAGLARVRLMFIGLIGEVFEPNERLRG